MNDPYTPGPASGAQVQKDGEKWTLILVRQLRHPPAMVWQALTDPAHLSEWAPFEADRNLAVVGPVKLSTVGTPAPQVSETTVKRAEAPKLLEYSWGGNDLRWELEPLGSGTRLTLWHNIDRRYISSVILLKETADNEAHAAMLKKMVFERLNSGGVKLGSQETRNAVYGGPLNKLCIELSETDKFRRMWGIPVDPAPEERDTDDETDDIIDEPTAAGIRMFEKMEDVELVLRFFAYRQINAFKAGLNKISEFLDLFIVRGNRFTTSLLSEYRSMFESNISFLWEVLEGDAFTTLGVSKRPTKIVYDPLMYVANDKTVIPHRAALVAKKDVLRAELLAMYEANQVLFAGRRTNFKDTQDRNRCVAEAFATAIARAPSP